MLTRLDIEARARRPTRRHDHTRKQKGNIRVHSAYTGVCAARKFGEFQMLQHVVEKESVPFKECGVP